MFEEHNPQLALNHIGIGLNSNRFGCSWYSKQSTDQLRHYF